MVRNIFLVLGGILFLAIVVPMGLRVLLQLPAESFLKDFSTLKAGTSTFADVQQIRARHPGKSQNMAGVAQPCTSEHCELWFAFANRGLNSLPGAKVVALGGNIVVKNGLVEAVTLVYGTSPRPDPNVPEEIDDPQLGKAQIVIPAVYQYGVIDAAERAEDNYGIKKSDIDSRGIPHTMFFRLGPRSLPADRSSAYSIDLSCLAKWHGCDSASAIYPAHWQSLQ